MPKTCTLRDGLRAQLPPLASSSLLSTSCQRLRTAAPPPPAVEEVSPAVVAQEDAELALIEEQLRLNSR